MLICLFNIIQYCEYLMIYICIIWYSNGDILGIQYKYQDIIFDMFDSDVLRIYTNN